MKNDLGVDPHEWFDDKHVAPIPAWDKKVVVNDNKYAPPERRAELEENPRPEEEIADWFMEKPDESDEIEQEKTMHQKMYEIATAKYNPFAIGGSDNFQGGSENITQS